MACAAQIFSNITVDVWGKIQAAAKDQTGIALGADTGSASKEGFTVTWAYAATAQTLTVQCTSKPFFVPGGMVNQKIHDLIDGCTTS